jgi:hypothetical protein
MHVRGEEANDRAAMSPLLVLVPTGDGADVVRE